jgi:ABC-type thiamine transport system ATPase subunit
MGHCLPLLTASQQRHGLTVLPVTHHRHETETLAAVNLRLENGLVLATEHA